MKYAIALIFFASIIININAALKPRIVGGENAEIINFPYQASIHKKGRHFCGGAIVSDKHILTAAHCVDKERPPFSHIIVSTGATSSRTLINPHTVEKITIHSRWVASSHFSFVNDIAIIKLTDRIHFNDLQQKIELVDHDIISGKKGFMTGWGHTERKNGKSAIQLQKLEMTVLNSTDCQSHHKIEIHDTQMCAYVSGARGACFGDSGNPLVIDNKLVGIVSWLFNGNCGVGIPEVYTNVYAQRDFIISQMNK